MKNKRGDEKYYLIISLILGLLVLSLSLYFIFNEYFSKDDLDWQECRQSIVLRTNSPNLEELGTDLKGSFPLRCRTEVVNIDSAKTSEEVFGVISNAIAEGWYMFGEGKFDFIHRKFWTDNNLCMVFARIHYSPEAYKDYEKSGYWGKEFMEKYGFRMDNTNAFIDYYNTSFVGKSKDTYNEYLPIFVNKGDISSDGNLYVNWRKVEFVPKEEGEDLFLVYKINQHRGAVIFLNSWLVSKIPLLDSDRKIEGYEKYRSFVLTTSDELRSNIGCDKFLTIPA